MATRGELKTRLQRTLRELFGTDQNNAFWTLDDDITNAASELAEATYAYYGRESTDVFTGQEEYCGAPSIFRITTVTATWADGSTQILKQMRGESIDNSEMWWQQNWRSSPESGNPWFYVPLGLNRIKIYPVPNYTSDLYDYTDLEIGTNTRTLTSAARPFVSTDVPANGAPQYVINITGGTGFNTGQYRVISVASGIATVDRSVGTTSSTGGVGSLSQGGITVEGYSTLPGGVWASDDAECPLPTTAHDAVMLGAAIQRSIEFPAENNTRLAQIQARYSELRGKLGRRAGTQSRATADHAGSSNQQGGTYRGMW